MSSLSSLHNTECEQLISTYELCVNKHLLISKA